MDFGEVDHPAYDHIDARKNAAARHGTQAGDPAKAAKVFYDLAVMNNPPMRCIVGTDAYELINKKIESYTESIKEFENWSKSTDVDGYQAPSSKPFK
jgi:hypothetical protein